MLGENVKRKVKQTTLMIIVGILICLIAAPTAFAADFTTNRYNTKINIKNDNSAYVTEDIYVDFNTPQHGPQCF